MPLGQSASKVRCRNAATGHAVFVGDFAPEELDEIGPAPVLRVPESWTRAEYREQMLRRGVRETAPGHGGTGIEGYLDLAEPAGVLEKRPNTVLIISRGPA